jgi:hypothetical protein
MDGKEEAKTTSRVPNSLAARIELTHYLRAAFIAET